MCSECLHHPCHPRCPNADENTSLFICANCGETIDGESYFRDSEYDTFCSEDCALAYHGIELIWYGDDEFDDFE